MTPPRDPRLLIFVVDDSAVVRQGLSSLLSRRLGARVVTAPDPIVALQKVERERPDVILLDLEMPRMDGLTFLRKLMAKDPIPVVVCSGHAAPGADLAIRALEIGAIAVVPKPKLNEENFVEEQLLLEAIRDAAAARPRSPGRAFQVPERRLTADAVLRPGPAVRPQPSGEAVVAIGASTGGTEALLEILTALPPDSPGIVIVQHMPEGFTRAFANRLNSLCRIEVKEAESGDRVAPGRALIAPGNYHLMLHRTGPHYLVEVADGPAVSRHRPSVDVLFRSVAQAAGPNATGVILTGMGDDGAQGLAEMKSAGAFTIGQDEATCVVFGMPREAIARGAVLDVVPLERIAPAILRIFRERPSPRPDAQR